MSFRDSSYKGPSKGGTYLSIKEPGKHQFRIMGDVETYKRYWKGGRPYRFTDRLELPADVDVSSFNGKPQIEEVWAFVAIGKDEKGKPDEIGILTITQKTIQNALMGFFNDEDYGDFTNYDVIIEKFVDGNKTSYLVTPKPPKPVSKTEIEMYESFEMKDLSKKDALDDPNRSKASGNDIDPEVIPF